LLFICLAVHLSHGMIAHNMHQLIFFWLLYQQVSLPDMLCTKI